MPETRTFLFTDIEGSTKSQQQEPVAWKSNHELHDQIVREAVRENNGDAYQYTGDGFHAAFVTAPEALKAALDAQRKLGSTDWDFPLPIRAAELALRV